MFEEGIIWDHLSLDFLNFFVIIWSIEIIWIILIPCYFRTDADASPQNAVPRNFLLSLFAACPSIPNKPPSRRRLPAEAVAVDSPSPARDTSRAVEEPLASPVVYCSQEMLEEH